MRLATPSVITAAVLFLLAVPAAQPARAQVSSGVEFAGLVHHPLGAAVLDVDALGRLQISNIGSSGQDGVSVELATASLGKRYHEWRWNPPSSAAGSHQDLVLRGPVTAGRPSLAALSLASSADGSKELGVSFAASSSPGGWVEYVDSAGVLGRRQYEPLLIRKRIDRSTPLSPITESQVVTRCGSAAAGQFGFELRFESDVLIRDVGSSSAPIVCRAIIILPSGIDLIASPSSLEMTGAVSATSAPGVITIASEGVELSCPTCAAYPDGAGEALALGAARFEQGGTGGITRITNIGSSGQDGVRVIGEQGCCRTSALSLSLTDLLPPSPTTPSEFISFNFAKCCYVATAAPISSVHGFCVSGKCSIAPDFTPYGATGSRVRLYRNGALLADVTNPTSPPQIASGDFTVSAEVVSHTPRSRIMCRTFPCPGWTVTLGTASYLADEIVFDPIPSGTLAPPSVEDVSSMEFKAMGIASFGIAGVAVTSSAPLLAVDSPREAVQLAAARLSPNPAAGPVRVLFALPFAARARISVLDVAGRQVRELVEHDFTAGAHDLAWDGRDDSGRATPAGVYFVRVEAGANSRVSRMTRLW